MSILGTVEAAASPYVNWIKLGVVLAALAGAGYAGWTLKGWQGSAKIATAQVSQAHCETARTGDRANANSVAAGGVTQSAGQAKKDNDASDKTNQNRAAGYAGAQDEASHAKPSGVTIDVAPLRILFGGMRDADATAAAGGP